MGLSVSLLHSAWNEILRHEFFDFIGTTEVMVRSISFERKQGEVDLGTCREESETHNRSFGSDKMSMQKSVSFKNREFTEPKLKASDQTFEKSGSTSSVARNCEKLQINNPTIVLPEPMMFISPKPVSELDAAATTLQKVYKSYRTRRNLADCAVVVEELWWQALDFAALKRSSVSFYNIEKHESAESRWARARTRAAKVGKGLCKDEKAQKLALQHWLEAIDPRHRYGHNLQFYHDVWSECRSSQPFFYWLDVGDGKDTNVETCPRTVLQSQCIKYLGPKERDAYEVIVENGRLVHKPTGMPVDTVEGSKSIFVLSTSRALYVGQKRKGYFQHSSFLSGGATTAAGRLVAHNGVVEAVEPYSGHYRPTEDNFREFISFLEEHHVDLTNVKMCATDDDNKASCKAPNDDCSKTTELNGPITNDPNPIKHQNESTGSNTEAPVFELSRLLSCKWTSGLGPRIGCVRDYPANLQSIALEQVNLSPKVSLGRHGSFPPIPSPRPSPKIRVSPRLAYMGRPSPRVSVPTAN